MHKSESDTTEGLDWLLNVNVTETSHKMDVKKFHSSQY